MFEKIISTIKKGVKKENVLFSLLIALICVGWSSVSASVLDIIELHFELSENTSFYPKKSATIEKKFKNSDLRFVLSESEDFINTDLTELLKASDREKVLTNYILDGINLEQALNYHYNSQGNQLNNDKAQLASCQWDLNTANTNYKTALAMNQEALYTQAINQAKKARTCIGEYSVSTSSLTTLNHKIARYRTAIQKRTQYLQQNQNIIIKNYDMLNINKLRELQSITSALESTKK